MDNNIVDKRTKGELFVSHSPVTRDKLPSINGFGRWRKSVKNQKSIGGTIVCNCFGNTKEEAEANAAFICKAVNNYDSLLEALSCLVQDIEHYSKVGVLPSSTAISKAKAAIAKAEE